VAGGGEGFEALSSLVSKLQIIELYGADSDVSESTASTT